ncbi:hypothetical protein J4H86_05145 [Spiractinospora alimapuensis]|uniref:hypothetical protein n=1 Tax=Spiractinospora alimapuensis TaxID=2820884 RepID=UPI001F4427C4|nr:hypothetical protein [Spiractinospora alimapuensis]QVQ53174.1 hypothetical protein J4H86_05145 [Spiractinospora alimapuensis]
MTDDHTPSGPSVYHDQPDGAFPDRPRAFYIDVYVDDETDDTEHAYYGATNPEGGAVARGIGDRSILSLSTPERFADRVGGFVVWC